jgi:Icc protein
MDEQTKHITRREFIAGAAAGTAGCALLQGCDTLSLLQNPDLRFVHITDSHTDIAKPVTFKWLDKFVRKVNTEYSGVDFVLVGGDNFNNNASDKDDALRFKRIMGTLKMPYYAVRGNKEASPKPAGTPLDQRDFDNLFFNQRGMRVNGRDWKIEKGNYTILGIDTTITGHGNGIFTKKSLDFVENELKRNPGRHHILLNHQTYLNFWCGTENKDIHKYVINNVEEVKKRLFKYDNLAMTISGHKHVDNITKIGHVDVVSTIGFIVPNNGNPDDHRFRYVRMKNGEINTQRLVSIL